MHSTHGTSFGFNSIVQSKVQPGNFRRRAILGLSAAAAVMAMGKIAIRHGELHCIGM